MSAKKLYLNYKDENGEVDKFLYDGLLDIRKIDGFSGEEFYSTLDKVIRKLSPNNSFEIIRMYPSNCGPIHLFGVFHYFLKDLDTENELESEFDYLSQFVDYRFDLFMVLNYVVRA